MQKKKLGTGPVGPVCGMMTENGMKVSSCITTGLTLILPWAPDFYVIIFKVSPLAFSSRRKFGIFHGRSPNIIGNSSCIGRASLANAMLA